MKLKTIEQAKELGLYTHSYKNGAGEYQDTEGYYHLFRNGEEILPDVKKLAALSYSNGDGEYKDIDGYYHLFRDGKELLPEIKKTFTQVYFDGDGEYRDTNEEGHTVKGDNNET